MLEKHLAKDFGEIFSEYPIHIPDMRRAGWPDRAIQLRDSKLIFFELKIVEERYGGQTVTISELTNHQAAWLAKWQKHGGFCYLFLGIVNYNGELTKYAILRCSNWGTWLKVSNSKISISQLITFEDKHSVLKWFKDMFVPQSTRANPVQ